MMFSRLRLLACLLTLCTASIAHGAGLPGWRLAIDEKFDAAGWINNWEIKGDIGRTDDGALRNAGGKLHAQYKLSVTAPAVRVEFQAAILEPDKKDRMSDLTCIIGDVLFLFGNNDNTWTGLSQNGHTSKRVSVHIEPRKLHTIIAEIDGHTCRFYIDGTLVSVARRAEPFKTGKIGFYTRRGRAMFDNVRVLLRRKISPVAESLDQLSPPRFTSVTPDDTVFLTWQDDPTTTVTVQWLSSKLASQAAVEFARQGTDEWKPMRATNTPFPYSNLYRYRAHLTGLSPDTTYQLRFAGGTTIGLCRTMPAKLTEPLTFVNGGDLGDSDMTIKVCKQVAKRSPRFALIGGDIAYADGHDPRRWVGLLHIWRLHMVDPQRRLIPFVPLIGNHEVRGGFGQTRKNAPLFLCMFGLLNARAYTAMDIGNYMSLFLLDSGHITPVAGEQTDWLDQALAERRKVPHRLVCYHVPAWPSVRDDMHPFSKVTREHWVPLFEKHGIRAVFEYHDHAFKRTHPMRGGKQHEDGIIFFGDGAWGVPARPTVSLRENPYLAVAKRINHFFETQITATGQVHRAIDAEGNVFDEVVIPLR